jgi:hypothetical protein
MFQVILVDNDESVERTSDIECTSARAYLIPAQISTASMDSRPAKVYSQSNSLDMQTPIHPRNKLPPSPLKSLRSCSQKLCYDMKGINFEERETAQAQTGQRFDINFGMFVVWLTNDAG